MFVRHKDIKRANGKVDRYYYLVRTRRVEGKVVQENVAYLGKHKRYAMIKAKDMIDADNAKKKKKIKK